MSSIKIPKQAQAFRLTASFNCLDRKTENKGRASLYPSETSYSWYWCSRSNIKNGGTTSSGREDSKRLRLRRPGIWS